MTKKELIELIAPAIGESENRTNTILNKIVEVLTNEVVK
jgi:nucleoid DNA-binding protein